ncbi:MoaD/ThiS family protein [Flavobacterium gilvum]|uniref:Molybdopterin synthase sulfur carrier subunit n=1 Tax=Flavobacterium gilvum TaxID=1492737 RepID=A0AAC9I564_9FLAO|nr:MoaD/ThiS family protein [Flavobacterium gilvum]AOW09885.1 molybdopterin synthase sulfur carrier subunit [Flavobacterium gilvum]KFC58033.1 sulfur transfer protein ThiS [Flavobacterium gilvum]
MIVIKYFGGIVERTRCRDEKFDFSDLPLSKLLTELDNKYHFGQYPFSVAVNQEIIDKVNNQILKNNDVVALLPPFAGG